MPVERRRGTEASIVDAGRDAMTIQELIDALRRAVAEIAEKRGVTMAEVVRSARVLIDAESDFDIRVITDMLAVEVSDDPQHGWVAVVKGQ